MNQNHISATLTAEDQTAVLAALTTIKQKLPFLVDLSPEDRQSLPKLGDKSRAFVSGSLEVANQNEGILPRAFDLPEFKRDVQLVQQLTPIAPALEQRSELVSDTAVAVGSDAYTAALTVYQSARLAGKGAGLDDKLDALSQRFARKNRPATPPSADK
jgi:hypothetical protein